MNSNPKPWWDDNFVAPPRAFVQPLQSEEGWQPQPLPAGADRWFWANCERIGGGWSLQLKPPFWQMSVQHAISVHQALFCFALGPLTLELYFEGLGLHREGKLNHFFSNKATLPDE